jgi:hypothetical protein
LPLFTPSLFLKRKEKKRKCMIKILINRVMRAGLARPKGGRGGLDTSGGRHVMESRQTKARDGQHFPLSCVWGWGWGWARKHAAHGWFDRLVFIFGFARRRQQQPACVNSTSCVGAQ